MRNGFYGFSWTTFFFGFFSALFPGDFITFIGGFVIAVIVGLLTLGVGAFCVESFGHLCTTSTTPESSWNAAMR